MNLRLYRSAPFDQFVSLGSYCAVKFQSAFSYARRRFNGISAAEFSEKLHHHEASISPGGTHFFDWNVTEFDALITVLNADFAGVFERENLAPTDDRTSVIDSACGILFHHDFTRVNGLIDEATIDAEFPVRKQRIEHLIDKFRRLGQSHERILYIVKVPPLETRQSVLVAALRRRNPLHDFHVLFVTYGESDLGLICETAQFTFARINGTVRKSPELEWTGDDEYWGTLLDPIPLRAEREAI